ncbi:LysR family transcriptional regulator [Hamadaea tsunoensis]|uniref:LysR family transcriptional regulator n=1 Tax=Hamadaea tsunoensis TaxID=53368 RepID=UPI00041EA587|nr:LysR family transcriptional regulator [Hamadaea tsunoensis]
MDVELRHLRAFLAVVDAGSFTEAATALGITQASVSRAVAALEEALGVRLLRRTTRHVALTPAGTRAVASVRRIVTETARLRQVVEQTQTELRVGYAWAALGRHTRRVQKEWAAAHPGVPLVFVQANSVNAGLGEGLADIAVLRRPLDDPRFATAAVGTEPRYAAVAGDNPLARRRSVRLADLARYTVAIDSRTGTTTLDLWPPDEPPRVRRTHGLDEWLTLIAAGQAVGLTAQATAQQNPRPGVAYRPVADAPPITVALGWWRADPPAYLAELLDLVTAAYQGGERG